ncbi:hypothetical protein K461DRAFT_71148 [Myriangium duriaei CBS 260.36]|uniref:Uncharacterized protein n=1 Tax=Myriangium duriaei CBS 260.36 TaxID=1168546 RepID=A0A9P4ISI8_9PEZI|nr:hypothetical protein K461DRAFT_71148 [Myriangium duriaei CBS 260.36]
MEGRAADGRGEWWWLWVSSVGCCRLPRPRLAPSCGCPTPNRIQLRVALLLEAGEYWHTRLGKVLKDLFASIHTIVTQDTTCQLPAI